MCNRWNCKMFYFSLFSGIHAYGKLSSINYFSYCFTVAAPFFSRFYSFSYTKHTKIRRSSHCCMPNERNSHERSRCLSDSTPCIAFSDVKCSENGKCRWRSFDSSEIWGSQHQTDEDAFDEYTVHTERLREKNKYFTCDIIAWFPYFGEKIDKNTLALPCR